MRRVGIRPGDADSVNSLKTGQVQENPLRMQRIIFARVSLREVRIAFPVGTHVAVGETREALGVRPIVMRDAAMRQRVAVGMSNRITQRRAPREISLPCRIAPG